MRSQPTLLDVPAILARTILRTIARIIFAGAVLFLLVGIALTLLSVLLATWRSPRTPRVTLLVDIARATTELVKHHK